MKSALLLPFVVALGLASAPTAQADAFKPSKAQQVQLGRQAANDLRKREKTLPATDMRVKTLRRVAHRLLSTVSDGQDPWEYSFDVIDSKDVNAFALPGGATFFYTGLLDKMKSEDELAGVLGHELTHVRKEHWAYAYADSQKRQLGLVALLSIFNVGRSGANLASIGNELLFELPFSRRHELEADDGGYRMMVDAGYNPQGIVDVFSMLQKEANGGKPPEFLSTHPNEKNRIRRLTDKIAADKMTFPPLRPLKIKASLPAGAPSAPGKEPLGNLPGRRVSLRRDPQSSVLA